MKFSFFIKFLFIVLISFMVSFIFGCDQLTIDGTGAKQKNIQIEINPGIELVPDLNLGPEPDLGPDQKQDPFHYKNYYKWFHLDGLTESNAGEYRLLSYLDQSYFAHDYSGVNFLRNGMGNDSFVNFQKSNNFYRDNRKITVVYDEKNRLIKKESLYINNRSILSMNIKYDNQDRIDTYTIDLIDGTRVRSSKVIDFIYNEKNGLLTKILSVENTFDNMNDNNINYISEETYTFIYNNNYLLEKLNYKFVYTNNLYPSLSRISYSAFEMLYNKENKLSKIVAPEISLQFEYPNAYERIETSISVSGNFNEKIHVFLEDIPEHVQTSNEFALKKRIKKVVTYLNDKISKEYHLQYNDKGSLIEEGYFVFNEYGERYWETTKTWRY